MRLDDGQLLTEGPAIVQYLADLKPEAGLLPPPATLARARVQEWLTFIGTELHKNFSPLFNPQASADWKAAALGVSAAYLSALEHGRRGAPNWALVQKIIGYFNVIWDDAEQLLGLARISHPRVTIDTSGLDPRATELANRLALSIEHLSQKQLDGMIAILEGAFLQAPK